MSKLFKWVWISVSHAFCADELGSVNIFVIKSRNVVQLSNLEYLDWELGSAEIVDFSSFVSFVVLREDVSLDCELVESRLIRP